jgi:DNA-3-methyladenine glycosylase II
LTVSHAMKEKIVQKFGGHINIDGVEYHSFPEPKSLPTECEKIVEVIKNNRKAEYLAETANAFSRVDEQWLRNAPFDDVYSWLTEIKGIGPWSAHFVLIRGLGRMERLSTVDGELALAVGRIYKGKEEVMAEKEVRDLAEKYGKWQGYWAYYLRIYA